MNGKSLLVIIAITVLISAGCRSGASGVKGTPSAGRGERGSADLAADAPERTSDRVLPSVAADPAATDENAAPKAPPAVDTSGLKVYFLLDPRITRGMYMGDHWVSPPSFTRVFERGESSLPAKAMGLDAAGAWVEVGPSWTAADDSVIKISPSVGHQVEITAIKAGKTKLTVILGKASRTLDVETVFEGGVWKITASQ
jgi:hypothetical protein